MSFVYVDLEGLVFLVSSVSSSLGFPELGGKHLIRGQCFKVCECLRMSLNVFESQEETSLMMIHDSRISLGVIFSFSSLRPVLFGFILGSWAI